MLRNTLQAFSQCFRFNSTIEKIILSNVGADPKSFAEFANCVMDNIDGVAINQIDFSYNLMKSKGAIALATTFARLNLQMLDIRYLNN